MHEIEDNVSSKFIQIDEEGYFQMGEVRVSDNAFGYDLFTNLHVSDNGSLATFSSSEPDNKLTVEAFDEPFVVQQIKKVQETSWKISMPYGFSLTFQLEVDPSASISSNDDSDDSSKGSQSVCTNLSLDEWDRFHGKVTGGKTHELSFVLSRSAQADLFNQLEDFDDTGIFIKGKRIEITNWLTENNTVSKRDFWSDIYNNEEPRWELKQANPILKDIIPQLKLPRSRILVLGCGSGNDAAHLAHCGHIVTGVDFSPEAIQQAQDKYSGVTDLNFELHDIFSLPQDFKEQFDLVFEHTCYCAITPSRRNQLIDVWKQCLAPGGHLLGVFFATSKTFGPPYGGSEWEVRQRLNKKRFRPLYWNRWRHSLDRRLGKELVVYAQKQ